MFNKNLVKNAIVGATNVASSLAVGSYLSAVTIAVPEGGLTVGTKVLWTVGRGILAAGAGKAFSDMVEEAVDNVLGSKKDESVSQDSEEIIVD